MCNEDMTRNIRHLEILIGIVLIILSVLSFYLVYWEINWRIDFIEKHTDNSLEISWFKIVKSYHLSIITNLILLLGSVFLLLRKKTGWIITLIYGIYSSILWIIFASTSTKDDFEFFWLGYFISLFFVLIVIFLLSKSVRAKYQPNRNSLIVVLISVSALILYRFII